MQRVFLVSTCLILLLLTPITYGKSLTAQVDRHNVTQGETFQLQLKLTGQQTSAKPDLTPLRRDFIVYATSNQRQMQIINGTVSANVQWLITLAPKTVGNLTIPKLRLGQFTTQPIAITVSKPSSASSSGKTPPIFLKVNVSIKQPYVQSQVLYTLRIYYSQDLASASLTNPVSPDAIITRIGQDINYTASHNGVMYSVIERRFAVFPQKAGKLVIHAPMFHGEVVKPLSANARGIFSRMLSNTFQAVNLAAANITLHVKPKPTVANGQWWLPAKNLKLDARWSQQPPKFKVGEPITRTISITAEGLTAAQLPEIPTAPLDKLNTYPDKPVLKTTEDGAGVSGMRQEKIAYIPTQAGPLQLPEISIVWFNTTSKKFQVAKIPTVSVNVQASEATSQAVSTTLSVQRQQPLKTTKPVLKKIKNHANLLWPGIAFTFAFVWLLTLFFWWHSKRPVHTDKQAKNTVQPTEPKLKILVANIKQACLTSDPQLTQNSLLAWANANYPKNNFNNLEQIKRLFTKVSLLKQFEQLDNVLYANRATTAWQGKIFWHELKPELKQQHNSNTQQTSPLADLYPH